MLARLANEQTSAPGECPHSRSAVAGADVPLVMCHCGADVSLPLARAT